MEIYSNNKKLWSETTKLTINVLHNDDHGVKKMIVTKDKHNKLPQDYAYINNAPDEVLNYLLELSQIPLKRSIFSLYSNDYHRWQETVVTDIDELNDSQEGQVYKMRIYRQVKNKLKGLYPLHVGLINHASVDVAERLYDLYPEGIKLGDKYGRLAIHCAIIGNIEIEFVKRLYFNYKEGITVVDERYGYTPLHYAVKYNRKEHIPFLLSQYPNAINVKAKKFDEDGNLVIVKNNNTAAAVINGTNTTTNIITSLSINVQKLNVHFHEGDLPIDIAKKDYQLSEIYEMLYNYRRTIEMYKGEKDGDRVDL